MTVTMKGRAEFARYIAQQEKKLSTVLRGAARAAARVIADEAKEQTVSGEVASAIVVRTKATEGQVVSRVTVKEGWARSLALWEEYGTRPHFISVSDENRQGRGTRRINTALNEAKGDTSLVINGKFVGPTVLHPGVPAHPFLRTSLDLKEGEALKAAQNYINAKMGHNGGPAFDESDDE